MIFPFWIALLPIGGVLIKDCRLMDGCGWTGLSPRVEIDSTLDDSIGYGGKVVFDHFLECLFHFFS